MNADSFANRVANAIRDDKKLIDEVATLTAAQAQMRVSENHIKWTAQTVHQAYHQDQPGLWTDCPRDVCTSSARVLEGSPL